MNLTLRSLLVLSMLSAFLVPGIALAGECVTKTGWYVPWNCTEVGKTQTGKYIFTCCD